jgi:predicted regulator of Ras-like GTPase activity (Roadblock/LC7/MglB family)
VGAGSRNQESAFSNQKFEMKIPFADLFQKSKARLKPAPPPPKIDAPMPTAKKSESERLAKTVMPSTARAVVAEKEEEMAKSGPLATETARLATPAATVAVMDTAGETPAGPTAETAMPRISMGVPAQVPMPNLPPAVAVALAPDIERAISLPLEDVIAQMPDGYLKPRASLDVNRAVLLKAAEVEKGMATGRPAIAVATLFEQAPDIFTHTVPSTDGAMVALPFERVMSALSSLAVRSDQAVEQAVPQVETPFLQVTKEDTERFGTPMPSSAAPAFAAAEASAPTEELPPVRIELPTAEAYAAAVPEATDTFVPKIDPENAEAQRIPFEPAAEPGNGEKFGTGEPAFPRVPASSGPPVPLAAPAPAGPALTAPASIPFSFPAPSDEATKWVEEEQQAEGGRVKAEGQKPAVASQTSSRATRSAPGDSYNEPVLTLPLRPILQHLPPMQLGGNPATVPEKTTVSFPMSMITPQLASGKVAVKPNAFYAALPDECRKLFLPGAVDMAVQLLLADVLGNLPEATLRMREDQEVHTQDETFETPFSAKAAEDAARFKAGGRGMKDESPGAPEATSTFDAKEAVAKASALTGVASCSVIFADGLSIAGNIPDSTKVEGLSAVAPTLLQKLAKHMRETSLGPLQCMTVHGKETPVSFFLAGNVCLTALHRGEELGVETRRQLVRMTEEISRAYSRPGSGERS